MPPILFLLLGDTFQAIFWSQQEANFEIRMEKCSKAFITRNRGDYLKCWCSVLYWPEGEAVSLEWWISRQSRCTFWIDHPKVADSCLHQEVTFHFHGSSVVKAFSHALIYCHLAPSLPINHLITKFHRQSWFSLTLASLQHLQLSASPPWHILLCLYPVSPITLLARPC